MRESLSALLASIIFFNGLSLTAFGQLSEIETSPDSGQSLSYFDITGPAGSGSFGQQVLVLSNDNIVVTDPGFDDGAVSNVGAVYLFSTTGVMISQLKGTSAEDQVGSGGVFEVGNGNFVALSPNWDNGGVTNAGAATWMSGTTGLTGTVSPTNSLVGSSANDNVGGTDGGGAGGLILLGNGNYLIGTVDWDNGATANVGAVTFGLGASGVSGTISSSNSLIGSTTGDNIGSSYALTSSDGDYMVLSPNWNNGAVADVGAATFGSGTTGVSGAVSTSNSLVGSTTGDKVGSNYVGSGKVGGLALSNGNFVVLSALWNNGAVIDAGAVTLVDGTTGLVGTVSSVNSLVGATGNAFLGSESVIQLVGNSNYVVWSKAGAGSATWCSGTVATVGTVASSNSLVGSTSGDFNSNNTSVRALSNGNYVVGVPTWDNGAVADAGAATWGNGTTGTTGVISVSNSLVGTTAGDNVGFNITPLTNGNYVVASPGWDNGAVTNAGVATWGNGTTGTTGAVSTSNSIVGSSANDNVGGGGVTALTNGNYIVTSPNWDNGAVTNAGAATWANGTGPTSAVVSAANSLVGSTSGDQVGYGFGFVVALTNGNYVVSTPNWDNGAVVDVGAVTWGDGTTGISGPVSTTNSLVGSSAGDQAGSGSVRHLSNGNYIVPSPSWVNGSATNAGAVTLGNGTTGTVGIISAANSLVGTSTYDLVGGYPYLELSDGRYIIWNYFWNNGSTAMAGSWTFFDGSTVGPVSSANSVVGNVASGGFSMSVGFNSNAKWAIGKIAENKVSIPGALPTSAGTKLEGRVVTADQVGIRGVNVTVTDTATGSSVTTMTNNFGKFTVEGLDSGSMYVVSVQSTRRYRFSESTRSLQLHGDIDELIFTAER